MIVTPGIFCDRSCYMVVAKTKIRTVVGNLRCKIWYFVAELLAVVPGNWSAVCRLEQEHKFVTGPVLLIAWLSNICALQEIT